MARAHPLEDARRRLKWAEEQIRDLDQVISRFFAPEPHFFVEDRETYPGRVLHWVKLLESPPEGWQRLVTHISSDLRAPLDYAVGQVIQTVTSDPKIIKKASFPFARDLEKLETELRKREIKSVCPDLADIIRAARPINPKQGGDALLFGLSELANSDKHRELSFIGMSGTSSVGSEPFFIGGSLTLRAPQWEPAENGLVVFETTEGTIFRGNVKFAFHVALTKLKGFEREPVTVVFDQMANTVKRLLLDVESRFFLQP